MDLTRFDAMIQTLAEPAPRRRTVRLLAAGALAAVDRGRAVATPVAAKRRCRRRNRPCARPGQCCSRICGHLYEGRHPDGLCRDVGCRSGGSPCQTDADCCEVRCSTDVGLCAT